MIQQNGVHIIMQFVLYWLKHWDTQCLSFYSSSCWFKWTCNYSFFFPQAAEQAKASPALVAKDPSTSTNKKEEEDLAKGKDTSRNSTKKKILRVEYSEGFIEGLSLKNISCNLEQRPDFCVSCVQPSSCLWRSSASSRRPPCRAFTRTPPGCSPRTSPTAGKSAPSMTLRPRRTTSSPSSRGKSSLSWTIGEFLSAQTVSGGKMEVCHVTERCSSELRDILTFNRIWEIQTKPLRCSTETTTIKICCSITFFFCVFFQWPQLVERRNIPGSGLVPL